MTYPVLTHPVVLPVESQLSAFEHIQKLKEERFAAIVSHIGFPTLFLSHSWRYKLLDIVESLATCDGEEVVWFDILSVGQNGGAAKPFDWWRDTFFENVRSIGKVVMVASPRSHLPALSFIMLCPTLTYAIPPPGDDTIRQPDHVDQASSAICRYPFSLALRRREILTSRTVLPGRGASSSSSRALQRIPSSTLRCQPT